MVVVFELAVPGFLGSLHCAVCAGALCASAAAPGQSSSLALLVVQAQDRFAHQL